jgi:nickel-dependent lactate racemase
MFGDAVVGNIRVVNHDARDAGQLAFAGTYGNGVPTWGSRRDSWSRISLPGSPAVPSWVITTNSGFPLDQNLYQAVKGMSAAYQVVRPGGMIVCAAECRDGFPDHGSYRQILASAASPKALADAIRARPVTVPDQWQVQIQAQIQASSRVVMHTSYRGCASCLRARRPSPTSKRHGEKARWLTLR